MYNYKSSSPCLSTSVPQGSILGPILFSMYINDLPMVCQQCNIIMYADDTVMFAHDKNAEEVANKLTDVLAKIIFCLNQCYLKLNVKNNVYVLF